MDLLLGLISVLLATVSHNHLVSLVTCPSRLFRYFIIRTVNLIKCLCAFCDLFVAGMGVEVESLPECFFICVEYQWKIGHMHLKCTSWSVTETLHVLIMTWLQVTFATALWRHNGLDGVSNHQPNHCLLSRYSSADQRKHKSSASLAFMRGIHRRPVNSPHKWPVTRKRFPFNDVFMKIEMSPVCQLFIGMKGISFKCRWKRQTIAWPVLLWNKHT